jgi:Polyketide cyclase / dehydrase and lipid transport
MHPSDYHFVTRWRVEATCGEVADILNDPVNLPRWWPSVYLDAEELAPPGSDGAGRRLRLLTKGWLPYTLRWEFVVVESRYPHGFTLDASGDFVGRGVWTIAQDGPIADVVYDWRIRADKPLLRELSSLLRPLFEANHRWAMAQGETSLKLELARRRATSDTLRSAVPPPPGPVTYAGVVLVAGAAAAIGGMTCLLLRARRSRRRRHRR